MPHNPDLRFCELLQAVRLTSIGRGQERGQAKYQFFLLRTKICRRMQMQSNDITGQHLAMRHWTTTSSDVRA